MSTLLEPLRRDDPVHVRRYNATFNAIWPEFALTDAEFVGELEVAGPARWWLVRDGDEPVGCATVERVTWNGDDAPPLAFLALPAARATPSAYAHLLDACAAFARDEGFDELRVFRWEREAVLGALLEPLDGWRVDEVEVVVGLDLTGPQPPAAPRRAVEGVRFTTLAAEPALAASMHACQRAAVPDVPGETHRTPDYDDWARERAAMPNLRDDAAFLAVDETSGEVLAFAQLELSEARPQVASHDYTVVHPDARGRGLAYAVKLESIRWARAAGYRSLQTENEERNAPMRHVNERLGYERVTTRIVHRGPVANLPDPDALLEPDPAIP